jgi:hypothetical protein
MTQGLPGAGGGGPVESAIPAGTYQVRQLVTYQYDPITNTYQQVNTEVITASDPLTGLPVRGATADQMEDLLHTNRALLRATVALLNELSGRETAYSPDDFLSMEEEGDG